MTSRRDFLKASALLASGLTPSLAHGLSSRHNARIVAPLNVLVLGGTAFIGPHLVRHLVARGHRVSIFTRGRRQADLPASVEHLIGDRDTKDANGVLAGNYDALKGRTWDVVIDDSANNPNWVRQSTELLKNATKQYVFVSSTGVFYPYRGTNIDETTKVRMSMDEEAADSFGVAKSQGEEFARQAFQDGAIIVRPTYIVGPGDTSDRFTYWPVRLARGGEVLAPGHKTDPVQFIDVRDLAEFMVKLVEEKRGGTYNVAGPHNIMGIARFLDEARKAVGPDVRFTWVDDYEFLVAQKLDFACPWQLPQGNDAGMMSVSNAKAIKAGLGFRPIAQTVKDTLAWWQTLPEARHAKPRFVLTPEREAEILVAWKARMHK